MATFSRPAAFQDHAHYVPLLKLALHSVKPTTPKKFLFYKEYPFADKKQKHPLVLVDFDLNCPKAIHDSGHTPTFEGTVSLTQTDELDFQATKKGFKRSLLRTYFKTMGPGIKDVFVPQGEVEEESKDKATQPGSQQSTSTTEAKSAATPTTSTQPQVMQPGTQAQTATPSTSRADLRASQGPDAAELLAIAASLKELKVAVDTLGPTATNKAEVDTQWQAAKAALQKQDLVNARAAHAKLKAAFAQALPKLPTPPPTPSTTAPPSQGTAPVAQPSTTTPPAQQQPPLTTTPPPTTTVPQQPPQATTSTVQPPKPPPRPTQAAPTPPPLTTPIHPAGQKLVQSRADAVMKEALAIAGATAKKAFPKGSAKAAEKQLSLKFAADRGKSLAKLTAEAESPNNKTKPARPETAKKEQEAAQDLQTALAKVESAGSGTVNPSDVDALDQACTKAVTTVSSRLKANLKRINESVLTKDPVALAKQKAARKELMASPDLARLASTMDLALETRLRKNANLAKQLQAAIADVEKGKTEDNVRKLRDLAQQHANLFLEHAEGYANFPGLKRPSKYVELEKFATDTLLDAEQALFSLSGTRLGPPPWPADKQAEGNALLDKGREVKALDAYRQGKSFRPSGGQSDVLVLTNKKGKVEFAFKSAQGESSQMGLPPGGGAIREAISSKVSDAILEQTGYDFGFPKATIASLNGKVGALIEGVQGRELPAADKIVGPKQEQEVADFQNKVPGKELQKVAFCGIVTGNILDLKWDNVFWEGDGANAKARPFDAGASFLPTKELQYNIHGRVGAAGINVPLLLDATGKKVKGAQEPMDPDLVAAILKLDVRSMRKTVEEERKRHQASGLDQCLDDESLGNGVKCLAAAQKVLAKQRNQPLTLEQFIGEFGQDILTIFPQP